MKNLALFAIPASLALLVLNLFFATVSFPNTYISHVNVSSLPRDKVKEKLAYEFSKPINIKVKDRVYSYTLESLGIQPDINGMLAVLFEKNFSFPFNIYYFAQSFFSKDVHDPTLHYTALFNDRMSSTVFDFSKAPNEIHFDEAKNQFVYHANEEKYKIDPGSFQLQLKNAIGKKDISIIPSIIKIPLPSQEEIIEQNNLKFAKAIEQPVNIIVDEKKPDQKIELTQNDLKQVLGAKIEDKRFTITTDHEKLTRVVEEKFKQINTSSDRTINTQKIEDDLVTLLDSRVLGLGTNTILATTEYKPNTTGEKASKYIEIDLSQQRMYRFENGNIIASHLVSTGLYYPTPPGEYKILNKYKNAFSDIYHVWMPYWMAFYRAPDINAYLGIHELPYWVAGDGTQIRRPRDFLGTPKTGGCVSLDVGVAEIVYNWADVGTPVLIYN